MGLQAEGRGVAGGVAGGVPDPSVQYESTAPVLPHPHVAFGSCGVLKQKQVLCCALAITIKHCWSCNQANTQIARP